MDRICRSVFGTISVFRFRLLTKDYEINKILGSERKSVHEVQVIKNYQQSGHQKVLDPIIDESF